jgi:5'-nucleotidase
MKSKPQILLTNDDGIRSPGLWAAAAALAEIGYVHVIAPREQCSGAGRSMPTTSDGVIRREQVHVNGQMWSVHAVGGTPAQAVQHGVLEILQAKPDLVVSGINYGENLGNGVTVSGTVGAAMEAAAMGIPAIAISQETDIDHHHSYSLEVDFNAAAYFAGLFGRRLLDHALPSEVHLLKVEVPRDASPATPWEITRLSMLAYFEPLRPERQDWSQPARVGYQVAHDAHQHREDSDVYVVRVKRAVAVTPLTLDLTARVDFGHLDRLFRR